MEDGKVAGGVFQANYVNGVDHGKAKVLLATAGTTDFETHWDRDWAVLLLDQPLGDTQGFLGVEDINASSGLPLPVLFAGYSEDFRKSEIAGADACAVRARLNAGIYGHDCSMSGGGSGGPLFNKDTHNILAINVRGYDDKIVKQYSNADSNIAVMSAEFVDYVKAYKDNFDK